MSELEDLLKRGVEDAVAPGLAAAVLRTDGEILVASAGVRGLDNPVPLTLDTIFYIASCTKPVTSVAALQLVERGYVALDEPIGDIIPDLADPEVLTGFDASGAPMIRPARSKITLRHLLTHTSGLAYDFSSVELTRYLQSKNLDFRQPEPPPIPLLFDPGKGWTYGIGIDWVGRLIESLTGEGLEVYCAANIFEPLNMSDTTFFPSPDQRARKASVHFHASGGVFIVAPFEMPITRHFWMGGAGLNAPVSDYMKFLAELAGGGRSLLGPDMFQEMMKNQVGSFSAGSIVTADPMVSLNYRSFFDFPGQHGLAGVLNPEAVCGGRSKGSMSWAGITNCYYWIDPTLGAAGILMSQVMPFGDHGILDLFRRLEALAYVSS